MVVGSRRYSVALRLDAKGFHFGCPCRSGEFGNLCRHTIAVALAWIHSASPPPPGNPPAVPGKQDEADPAAALSALSKADLLERVRAWAAEIPALHHRMQVFAASAEADTAGLDPLRTLIRTTIRGAQYRPPDQRREFMSNVRAVVEAIDAKAATLSPEDVIELSEDAIAALVRVLPHVDDPDDELMAVSEDLRDIHLRACLHGAPDRAALARRLFDWKMNQFIDTFHDVPASYARALGADGLAAYRSLVEAEWARVPPRGPGEPENRDATRRRRLTEDMEFFFERKGDVAGRIEVLARDLSSEDCFERIVRICRTAGEHALALDWADRGLREFGGDRGWSLAELAARIEHDRGRETEALDRLWRAFEAAPRASRFRSLASLAEEVGRRVEIRRQAIELLRERIPPRTKPAPHVAAPFEPASEVVGILLDDGDEEEAWRMAWEHGCSLEQWAHFVRLRSKVGSRAVLPVYRLLVDRAADRRNTDGYRAAVRWLRDAREAASKAGDPAWFERNLQEVRVQHKVRRNFIKMLAEHTWE